MIERAGSISRRDHETLSKLARRQEKVAKTQAAQRAAELIADFEEQLARGVLVQRRAVVCCHCPGE